MTREYIEMSFPLKCEKVAESSANDFNIDTCTMLMADIVTGNRTYFPREEIEKTVHLWEGLPIVINHESEDIRTIVGHISNVELKGNNLTCQPVFEKDTVGYPVVEGYIKSRVNANDFPNVSVGLWADTEHESKNGIDGVRVLRNHDPDHLGVVVHGSCDPSKGCGIGLSEQKEDFVDLTVDHDEYVGKDSLYEDLKKEIIVEKIKLERNKND